MSDIQKDERMKHIGYIDRFGTEQPFKSNNTQVCLECGIPITDENDSGWERFTEDGATTQPVCKSCDAKPVSFEKEGDFIN